MLDLETFRNMALSFPDTHEEPHFDVTSFRIKGKIFASLEIDKSKACLKFSLKDQAQFCSYDKAIYPVESSWGKYGWTYININEIREELMYEALESAFKEVSKIKSPVKS